MDADLLVVGQGLAGTLLAWEAHWLGKRVVVVDPGETETASRVAAGIVNPVTGRRLSKCWDFDRLFPAAEAFYRRAEGELGEVFFFRMPILRCLDDPGMQELWREKRGGAEYRGLWTDDVGALRQPEGGCFREAGERFATAMSGYLAVEDFLVASRRFFAARHRVIGEAVDIDGLEPDGDGVGYGGLRVGHAVLCQGAMGGGGRFFDWVPMRRAKGEVLDLRMEGCGEDRIINRRKWVLPLGGGRFRAGATYDWEAEDAGPTEGGRREIEAALDGVLARGAEVVGHRAAVRPVVKGRRLLVGCHPGYPRLAFMNGLGSKGVLNAPWHARGLVGHLFSGAPLEAEVDLRGEG